MGSTKGKPKQKQQPKKEKVNKVLDNNNIQQSTEKESLTTTTISNPPLFSMPEYSNSSGLLETTLAMGNYIVEDEIVFNHNSKILYEVLGLTENEYIALRTLFIEATKYNGSLSEKTEYLWNHIKKDKKKIAFLLAVLIKESK